MTGICFWCAVRSSAIAWVPLPKSRRERVGSVFCEAWLCPSCAEDARRMIEGGDQ